MYHRAFAGYIINSKHFAIPYFSHTAFFLHPGGGTARHYIVHLLQTHLAMATTKLVINSNGSTRIEGDFEIVDSKGNKYDLGGRNVVSLCRCGLSKNKPFCDGSHKGHFEHDAVAFDLPPKVKP